MPPTVNLTYTITSAAGAAAVFARVAPGAGMYALDFAMGPLKQDLFRFHPRGVAGNITVRDRPSGLPITCHGMLCGVLGTVWASLQGYFAVWRADPVSITDPSGAVFTKCNLLDARVLSLSADGSGDTVGQVELAFEASFTKDSDF